LESCSLHLKDKKSQNKQKGRNKKKKWGGGTEINDIEAKTNKQTNKESMKQKVCPLKK
jgi:anti-sigma28 factor (negative regulator of flagellin synthesis)